MKNTNDILIRIREVLVESAKSQTDIGKMIDRTPQYVWRILNVDDVNPSKDTIKNICKAFNIREEWILTGDEPMIQPQEDETAAYVAELLGEEENPLYDLIKAIMKTYSGCVEKDKQIIKSFAKDLKANLNGESRD